MSSQILDVQARNKADGLELAAQMRDSSVRGLQQPAGLKTLPTMLLYNQKGLRLYDDITTEAAEYYLFGAELEILKNNAGDIVNAMHRGTGGVTVDEVVLELGSGALRKTSHILQGLAALIEHPSTHPLITYYALDLEERELERTLDLISSSEIGQLLKGKVVTKGMWGTYDDGLKFIQSGGLFSGKRITREAKLPSTYSRDVSPASMQSESSGSEERHGSDTSPPSTPEDHVPPLHIMFLGSSLGNFSRTEQSDFLRALPLRPGSGDTLLLGMDHDNSKADIEEAYNDDTGFTKKFIMNGLKAAGTLLGDEALFDENNWDYVNTYNVERRRHEAFYKSKGAHTVQDPSGNTFTFLEDELIKVEESYKFSDTDAYTLFAESNLVPIQRWENGSRYSLWLLERPPFIFPLLSSPRAGNSRGTLVAKKPYSSTPFGVPCPQDWQNLWAAWDFITLRMIPPTLLFQKPIDLRHICLFYLGHIPTFLDIHLSRLLDEPHTEPQYFKDMFERGIDPNVDDPTKCHAHSEVPDNKEDWPTLNSILEFQVRVRARLLALYDDFDSGKRALDRRTGRVLFMTFEHEAFHAETLLYMLLQRAGSGTLPPPGFSTPVWRSLAKGWDATAQIESKSVVLGPETVSLGHDDCEMEDLNATDVKTHEFGWDNEHPKRGVFVSEFRIDWRPITNGQFYEFYRSKEAKDILLPASWIEENGKILVRTLYGPIEMDIAQHWPVITSYDNLSAYAMVQGGRLPTEAELRLFYDKFDSGYEGGGNIGFRSWHPVPATTGGKRGGGKGSNGGVWEWTSTIFDKYDGFQASELYPGYSMDFFDGAHQVVLGGSYATIPRIAERRSTRNWYQRNYPYPWVGGRVVYDIKK
ncbi:DUF323 domain-containing protein [Mycena floridula]|nr:DUF323 domain-containing protein [Mycena floridula]